MILSSFCFDYRLEDIEPIFQYPVNDLNNGNQYFFDLYYPGINTFIEVDEEHHETASSKRTDRAKERYVREELKAGLFKIRFHQNHGNICKQIEDAKLAMLAKENTYIWEPRLFDAVEAIKSHRKTILVSISKRNDMPVLEFPLQLTKELIEVPDLNIVYMRGKSGTVSDSFITQPYHWTRHCGISNPGNSLLQSGSTLYNKSENILYSPDLLALAFKSKRKNK